MKATFDAPGDLVRALKLHAVMQRRRVKDWVAEFLQGGLGMTPQAGLACRSGDSMVGIGQDGLPVIRYAPAAPASRMSMRELLHLEQAAHVAEDTSRDAIPVRHRRHQGTMRSCLNCRNKRMNISSLSTTSLNPCCRHLVTFDITSQVVLKT